MGEPYVDLLIKLPNHMILSVNACFFHCKCKYQWSAFMQEFYTVYTLILIFIVDSIIVILL
jgi:hypothetical protein